GREAGGAGGRFRREARSPTASQTRVPSTPPTKVAASACLRSERQPRTDCWTLAQGSAWRESNENSCSPSCRRSSALSDRDRQLRNAHEFRRSEVGARRDEPR